MIFIKSLFYFPTVIVGGLLIYKNKQNPKDLVKSTLVRVILAIFSFLVHIAVTVRITDEINLLNIWLCFSTVLTMNSLLYFTGIYQLVHKKVM